MIKLDITVHPTYSEPEIDNPPRKEPPKKKWRFPWRINMLAKPKPPITNKFQTPPPPVFKKQGPVEPATEFRCDQLSRPIVRKLIENKKLFGALGAHYIATIQKIIEKSWSSIYNYYRKKLRERKLRQMQRKMEKLQAKKPQGKALEELEARRKERLDKLATPKKVHLPKEIPREFKPLDDLLPFLESLATPKERHEIPPRELGKVHPRALTYEITEFIIKLAQLPQRFKQDQEEALPLGVVKRAALHAKCSERIEKLAMPSFSAREAKKQDEEKYDPWQISPNVLKYKATPRILELAKPLERE